MATAIRKLGAADHGLPLTMEEYEAADYQNGCKYELIDGKLYVSALPNPGHDWINGWLYDDLRAYSRAHPEITNYVSRASRLFVPGRIVRTSPEPDVAAFRDYPIHLPLREMRWQDLVPILAVEIVSPDDPAKDLIRNVDLYLQIPTIREYWILETRPNIDRPTLYVYRRRGQRWQNRIEVPFRGPYTTRLLPGFELIVDPRR
jgi:Uma2 family endonuclease